MVLVESGQDPGATYQGDPGISHGHAHAAELCRALGSAPPSPAPVHLHCSLLGRKQ